MPTKAFLRYLKITPRKTRLVADMIRGKKVEEAQNILKFTVKKAVKPILKLLNSAIKNAENNFHLNKADLFISKITVDEGPRAKRLFPRARGQGNIIKKKMSHISIELDEKKQIKK